MPLPALRIRSVTVQEGLGRSVGYSFFTADYEGALIMVGEDLEPYAELITNQFATAAEGQPDEAQLAVGAPFPNPTDGYAALHLSGFPGETAKVSVYDVLGREVAAPQQHLLGEMPVEIQLGTQSLPAGQYVVRIQAEGEAMARPLTIMR